MKKLQSNSGRKKRRSRNTPKANREIEFAVRKPRIGLGASIISQSLEHRVVAHRLRSRYSTNERCQKDGSMATKETNERFTSTMFGELYIGEADKVRLYCVSDICRALGILVREGCKILERNNCYTKELLIRRRVIAKSHLFTDRDGLLTLLIETHKPNANLYRKWIEEKENVIDICEVGLKWDQTTRGCNRLERMAKDDKYPTVDDYFRNYVPADFFVDLLNSTIKDYKYISEKSNVDEQKLGIMKFQTEVLGTFCSTLNANTQQYAPHF